MKKDRWWLAIPVAVLVMIVNIVVAVLWVALYSHFINPGHDEAYYQAYAQASVPYSAIIAGMPLMFMAAWWFSRRFTSANRIKAALLVWFVYLMIDLSILVLSGDFGRVVVFFIVSFVTKLGAAYLGGFLGTRRSV